LGISVLDAGCAGDEGTLPKYLNCQKFGKNLKKFDQTNFYIYNINERMLLKVKVQY